MYYFAIVFLVISESVSDSLMIIFNGMYFRGSWKQPFSAVEPGLFYKSSTEKKQVPMMKATGSFKTAYIDVLESEAVLLPYDVSIHFGVALRIDKNNISVNNNKTFFLLIFSLAALPSLWWFPVPVTVWPAWLPTCPPRL